jgi:putative ABC transport system permease protein
MLLEACVIALIGGIVGLLGGHGIAALGAHLLSQRGGLALAPFTISTVHPLLVIGITLLGACAGILPAVLAYRSEVAENLAPLS